MIKTFAKNLIFISTVFIGLSCNPQDDDTSNNCTPADGMVVELTSSLAGKTFNVGETVNLTWKADRNQVSNGQVVVDVSNDNGINWSVIPTAGIVVPSGDQFQCMSFNWVIGNEGDIVNYASGNNQCILRIHEYSNISNGVVFSSQTFIVKK
jgi:hypothetical protein